MLAGVVLSALCLVLPITGKAILTPPLSGNVVPAATGKDTSDRTMMTRVELQRTKRSLDVGGILQTIGLGANVGGVQLAVEPPNISLNTPIGTIACFRGRSRWDSPGNGEWQSSEE
uniref:Uncharacterized protein n=1 Tax=Anopheles farauti TaxID=69004 RepID=A0A182QVN4_9DIPT